MLALTPSHFPMILLPTLTCSKSLPYQLGSSPIIPCLFLMYSNVKTLNSVSCLASEHLTSDWVPTDAHIQLDTCERARTMLCQIRCSAMQTAIVAAFSLLTCIVCSAALVWPRLNCLVSGMMRSHHALLLSTAIEPWFSDAGKV